MNHRISDAQLQILKQFQDEGVSHYKGVAATPAAYEASAAQLETRLHLSSAAQTTAGDQP